MSIVRKLRAVLLGCGLACGVGLVNAAPASPYAQVTAEHALDFPADYGSHPKFRTEWWYVTGWLKTTHGEALGFQITFFRSKPDLIGWPLRWHCW